MLDIIFDTSTALGPDAKVLYFLFPMYTVLLVGERIAHGFMDAQVPWNNRDIAANIFITAAVQGLSASAGHLLPLAIMHLIYEHASVVSLGTGVWSYILGFILYDLAWYTDHRIAHRVGFMWAMHHVHHSSTEYNMTVASRGFILDATLLSRPTFYLLPLLGVSPGHFIVISIITNVWGIAQHTRLVGKLGWPDLIFATPSNHRVHHGSNEKYIDRNYGEVLIIWDHLFGTYKAEEEEPSYGVTDPINTYNPLLIEVAGFRWLIGKMQSAGSWLDALRCLWMPPEWIPPRALPTQAALRLREPSHH